VPGETRVIIQACLVTSVSTAFFTVASDYFSGKTESDPPHHQILYTGVAYIVTVAVLILPFLLLIIPFTAPAIMLTATVLIVLVF
jgi:VIT1/CCC1 family predicted Fe2+/Mn2+ transporter